MLMAELEAGYDLDCTLDWTWVKQCHGQMHAHLHKQPSAARISSFTFSHLMPQCPGPDWSKDFYHSAIMSDYVGFARSADSNPPLLSIGAMVRELSAQ